MAGVWTDEGLAWHREEKSENAPGRVCGAVDLIASRAVWRRKKPLSLCTTTVVKKVAQSGR